MCTVFCPVIEGFIDGASCLDIVLVADREAKPTILPKGVKWDDEQRKKCLACKYHSNCPTVCGTADPNMDGYFIMERNIKEDENNV